jgi:hypothetical protein
MRVRIAKSAKTVCLEIVDFHERSRPRKLAQVGFVESTNTTKAARDDADFEFEFEHHRRDEKSRFFPETATHEARAFRERLVSASEAPTFRRASPRARRDAHRVRGGRRARYPES